MKWIPITDGVWGGDIVECLVKLKSGKIVRLNYNYDDEFWYYPSTDETPTAIKKDCGDIIAWANCKEVDKDLNCGADRDLAWNFGTELMNRAIPALTLWIDKGNMNIAKDHFTKSFIFNKLHKKRVVITKLHMRLHIVYDPFDFKKRNFVSFYAAISWLKRYGNKNRFYQLDNILFVKVMNNKVYKYDFVSGISKYIY